jgi:hypothetical protein
MQCYIDIKSPKDGKNCRTRHDWMAYSRARKIARAAAHSELGRDRAYVGLKHAGKALIASFAMYLDFDQERELEATRVAVAQLVNALFLANKVETTNPLKTDRLKIFHRLVADVYRVSIQLNTVFAGRLALPADELCALGELCETIQQKLAKRVDTNNQNLPSHTTAPGPLQIIPGNPTLVRGSHPQGPILSMEGCYAPYEEMLHAERTIDKIHFSPGRFYVVQKIGKPRFLYWPKRS